VRPRVRRKGRPGLWGHGRRLVWAWWLWTLAAVVTATSENWSAAVATGLVAVFTYLVTPPEQSPKYGLESGFPVASSQFIDSIVGTTGVPFIAGNGVRLLQNGDEFYPEMLDSIRQARESVTIEAYIYWAGDVGMQFACALAERAQAGVKVKILLDAVGSSSIGPEILETLEGSGCQVAWYNPVRWGTVGRFNNRTHRKSLIVDGRIVFTGGAGIADHWTGHAQDPEHWRDSMVRIEGPGGIPLQTGFSQNWLTTTGELISGPSFFPPLEPSAKVSGQSIMSSPEGGSSAARIMYYLAIVCAQRRILIANAYFIPDNAALDILIEARQRGVDVKIMVPGSHNDMWPARYGGIQLYGKLLEAGIEIYEYERSMLHQKTMVVDSVWFTIGTTNFDNRSFALNEESNICIYDSALALELEETFMDDLRACRKIELDAWRKRSLKTRFLGAVGWFLLEQI
jgi:cardiolipin synthase